MIWLYLYVCVGVCLLGTLFAKQFLNSENEKLFNFDEEVARFSLKWFWTRFILPIIGSILITVLWPLWIYMVFEEWNSKRRRKKREIESEFRIDRTHLQKEMNIAEVEFAERITDPLGAVPDLPFGHLNSVWVSFLESRPANAQLWSFEIRWTDYFHNTYDRSGYVWVTEKVCTPWIVSHQFELTEVDD